MSKLTLDLSGIEVCDLDSMSSLVLILPDNISSLTAARISDALHGNVVAQSIVVKIDPDLKWCTNARDSSN